MTFIKRFEDIVAWQEARTMVKQVYTLTQESGFSKDFGMRDQIQRAAVSVMTNIAEGFDCDSNVEFGRFLGIARRSAVEVQSLLYTATDIGYLNEEQFQMTYDQANKVKRIIHGLKQSLRTRKP